MTVTEDNPLRTATAFLVVELDGTRRAGVLNGRVLIGRRAVNHIVVPDRAVSRIHAWIGRDDREFYIADTGSRTGTFINGRRVDGRERLADGDAIRIGRATVYYRTDAPTEELEEIDLSDRPIAAQSPYGGLFMDCRCGAPLWVPMDFAGRVGQCRYCGQTLTVRRPPDAVPLSNLPVRVRSETGLDCGICQSAISAFEDTTPCPSCGLTFHADCWSENRGCSSYGCTHVNALDGENGTAPAPVSPFLEGEVAFVPAPAVAPAPPWEFAWLGASVFALLLGTLSFGVPALLAGIGAAVYLVRRKPQRRAIVLLSISLAALGLIIGVAVSWYWWFGWKHTA